MYLSSVGKLRLMNRKRKMVRYYDDLGSGKGNCTMGYGHMVHRKPCSAEELAKKVTQKEVMRNFDSDVRVAENAVNRNVKVPLTQEQFDALVSYTFNRGAAGSHKAFTLINSGDFTSAAAEMSSHITASDKKKMTRAGGLSARRAEESAPFRKARIQAGEDAQK
jgi:lysozyme